MRIAMVSEHASPLAAIGGADAGGQNIHVAALARELVRGGNTVEVYTRRDDPSLPARVMTTDGVEIVHVDAGPPRAVPKDDLLPWMSDFGDRLAADWSASRPDIVHSHFWMSGVACLRAAELVAAVHRPPLVHTFHALGNVKRRHQGAEDTSPAERAFLEPDVGRRVDEVIATCSDEAFELIQLGIPSTRISVVPCGVDTEVFRPDGRAEARGAAHRIVTVGRLVQRKGVGTVISALALLARRGLDVELVVAGGSRPREAAMEDADVRRLARLAESVGVAERVSFRGQVPHLDLPELLRSADLVVCTPWYEPFGIVPLEAMATGVPVVASAVGGLIDTVVHGATGLHVPPRDPEATALAIDSLLRDPQTLAAFGRAGVERVAHRYTWEKVAADTERTYLRVLEEARRPAARRKARG